MASLDIGNLAGVAANFKTAISKEKGIKSFIKKIAKSGVQVKNNFEVNFSGVEDLMFYVQNIDIPGIKTNWTSINYNGRAVDIPINYDFDHSFSMTVLNDAHGTIYSALTNFMIKEAGSKLANSGYTMTIKALTGDHKHYPGALVTMNGVRIDTISGLSYGYSDNDIQTFQLGLRLIDFTYTNGAFQKLAGLLGAVENLIS